MQRFQVYNSRIHQRHIALDVYFPKSDPLQSPYTWRPPRFTTPSPPFPLITTMLLSVAGFLLVYFVCLFSVFYPTWVKSCDSWPFPCDLFRVAWYSQDPSMSSKMAAFRLFWCLSSIPLYTCTTSSLSSHQWRDTWVVSMAIVTHGAMNILPTLPDPVLNLLI